MGATAVNDRKSWSKRGDLAAAGDRFAVEALLDELPFEGAPVWGEISIPHQWAKGIAAGGNECLTLRLNRVTVRGRHASIPTQVCIGSLRPHRTDSQSPKAMGR